jgi:phenylpropionate dioxygenase-like ring-hydroxylating dioxygenase large terminal subunit
MSLELRQILDSWQPGHALPRAVYHDPAIYESEIRRIFLKSWHYVGHASQIPAKGDYFLFEMAGESVIVIRDGKGGIHALLNVCRHRGSRICDALEGHETRLTCKYHGWTYGLDGSLKAAGFAPEGLDKSRLGLKRLHVRALHGLIFVNFDAEPASFDPIERDLGPLLLPWRFEQAKIARRRNYPIDANWKLAVENYCECYHCLPAHPEYSVGHGRAIPRTDCEAEFEEVLARAESVGLSRAETRHSWLAAGAVGTDRDFERYPLLRGHVTGSRDGQPVAPLMGSITGYDGGATDLHMGPMTFGLAYCDHVVLYRFTPRGMRQTDCEITWLVDGAAVEGRDYDLEALTWLWDVTTIADKRIIERNQAGVDSRFYEPGPLSPMEDFTHRFLEWYVATMRGPQIAGTGRHGYDRPTAGGTT